ncbi:MAG: hypothetical protein K6B14_07370 [Lachnospiraceae bacterium]|nr:hypothetical protein [Lachnospiraceae bacterium]
MNVDLQTLAIVSVLTTLSTECIKKMRSISHKDYESNIIAMVISVILSAVLVIVKPICIDGAVITPAMIYNFAVMAFFGMLAANVGYDKLKELILAFKG